MWGAHALSEMLTINRRKPVVEKTDTAYLNPLAHPPYEPVEERLQSTALNPAYWLTRTGLERACSLY